MKSLWQRLLCLLEFHASSLRFPMPFRLQAGGYLLQTRDCCRYCGKEWPVEVPRVTERPPMHPVRSA